MVRLSDFYAEMEAGATSRRRIVEAVLALQAPSRSDVEVLERGLAMLEGLPGQGLLRHLVAVEQVIEVELGYEFRELRKDLRFIEDGQRGLLESMAQLNDGFEEDVQRVEEALRGLHFDNFVTDRDGTISNYAGRYRSSVQSVYNAVFLTRFVRACCRRATIVTSAPLKDPGVLSVSVVPPGVFAYGASKGRECLDMRGVEHRYPISPEQQGVLDRFNARLEERLEAPEFAKFALIGSGLQFKFGETTVACQDHGGSIPDAEVERWKDVVRDLVAAVDPRGEHLGVVDMATDVEVILKETVEGEFSKADGLRFLDQALDLQLDRGRTLVCGDTRGDLPLLDAAQRGDARLHTVFVTRDEALAAEVKRRCARATIVSSVDALVTGLQRLADRSPATTRDEPCA